VTGVQTCALPISLVLDFISAPYIERWLLSKNMSLLSKNCPDDGYETGLPKYSQQATADTPRKDAEKQQCDPGLYLISEYSHPTLEILITLPRKN